jgi:DNA modification methylase
MTIRIDRLNERCTLYEADCLDVLRFLPNNSVDSICTDPPAGISFMGKDWDKDKGGRDAWIAWMQEVAVECLRVVKPGGHALVWALPRTSHWTATAWENAGWEPRDKITHLFGSGFPKSLNVSKAIDKAAGAEREVVGTKRGVQGENLNDIVRGRAVRQIGEAGASGVGAYGTGVKQVTVDIPVTAPATAEAKQWDGWGTALKPAAEDWWLLRKPLDGTVAANVLAYGTGAINIDGCRVGTDDTRSVASATALGQGSGWNKHNNKPVLAGSECGRWPANCTHDGSDEVVAGFPESGGGHWSYKHPGDGGLYKHGLQNLADGGTDKEKGSAARFFYCAKASTKDREEGLDALPLKTLAYSNGAQAAQNDGAEEYTGGSQDIGLNNIKKRRNPHPTVKNTELMRYLTRLITPKEGICLDPFMGSGSTGKACMIEGFRFIGIEKEPEYLEVARGRILHATNKAVDSQGDGA